MRFCKLISVCKARKFNLDLPLEGRYFLQSATAIRAVAKLYFLRWKAAQILCGLSWKLLAHAIIRIIRQLSFFVIYVHWNVPFETKNWRRVFELRVYASDKDFGDLAPVHKVSCEWASLHNAIKPYSSNKLGENDRPRSFQFYLFTNTLNIPALPVK